MSAEPQPLRRDVIVVGGSAGAVPALQHLVAAVPADFAGSLFLVLHMPRRGATRMIELLAPFARLPLVAPRSRPIEPGTIYVATPDHHLVVGDTRVEAIKGASLHRHRPAVDVLFRSAALAHGPRVIGVVLSGLLDDGSSGLLEIKRRGGIAVVQDPADAAFPDMPSSALRTAEIDHCLPVTAMPPLLIELACRPATQQVPPAERAIRLVKDPRTLQQPAVMDEDAKPSPYSCPECHGVLWEVRRPELLRFRCRVGHGYSPETLAAEQDTAVEDAIWAAVRSLEEQAQMARAMVECWRKRPGPPAAIEQLERKAERCDADAARLRELLMGDEADVAAGP